MNDAAYALVVQPRGRPLDGAHRAWRRVRAGDRLHALHLQIMLHYFREAKLGAPLRVVCQLLEFDAKRARLWMEMRSPPDGAVDRRHRAALSLRSAGRGDPRRRLGARRRARCCRRWRRRMRRCPSRRRPGAEFRSSARERGQARPAGARGARTFQQMEGAHASLQTRRRRNAQSQFRARRRALRRGLLPRAIRRDACAVRRLAGGQAAAVAARAGPRLGDGRIRDAAARDLDPHAARIRPRARSPAAPRKSSA